MPHCESKSTISIVTKYYTDPERTKEIAEPGFMTTDGSYVRAYTDSKELKLPTKARSITANKPVEVTDTAERYMGEMNAEQTSIKEMEEEVKNYMTTGFEKTKGTIRSTIETSREEHIPVHSTSVEGEVGR